MLLWRRGDWPRVGSPDALWVRGFHEARPEVVCGICTSDEPTVSMTKRHFIRFAQLIAQQPLDKRASIAALVAVVAAEDNPRFDLKRFRDACDLDGVKSGTVFERAA